MEIRPLSPYAVSKSSSEILLSYASRLLNFNLVHLRLSNVYGPYQISKGDMATVIGIFENQYKLKKPLPIVKPGNQSRRFTHIYDTVRTCYKAWKLNRCRHYSISSKKEYSILKVAKMFKSKIKYLPKRPGERYVSALTNVNLSNKVHKYFGKINLEDYIEDFLIKNS